MNDVTVFGASQSGTRMAQVDLPRFRVQVTPLAEEHNEEAADAARSIAEKLALVDDLREHLVKARAESASLRSRLDGALSGKRRLFGRVLLAPVNGWTGEVWLMDPEKRERGFALRFGSLAECRLAHPELWPVGVQGDGVLLDAWNAMKRPSQFPRPSICPDKECNPDDACGEQCEVCQYQHDRESKDRIAAALRAAIEGSK